MCLYLSDRDYLLSVTAKYTCVNRGSTIKKGEKMTPHTVLVASVSIIRNGKFLMLEENKPGEEGSITDCKWIDLGHLLEMWI